MLAEEVRNMAARSSKAASETAELIEGSVAKVEKGALIADKTGEALEEIVKGVTKASDLVAKISTASNEQAQGIAQVNDRLSLVDQVTQQNTVHAEESSTVAEQLSGQVVGLQGMLAQFQLRQEYLVKADAGLPGFGGELSWSQEGAGSSPARPTQAVDLIALDDAEFG